MSQPSQHIDLSRRGHPIYDSNPSVARQFSTRIATRPVGSSVQTYIVAPESGEVVGEGALAFVEDRIVDSEQFVKVYLDGIRQYKNLSKTGAMLFEFVYREMSGMAGKDNDTIIINYRTAQRWKPDITRRTFDRGLNELLDKDFLYSTVSSDTFFINVRYMFNGDRMVLAQSYRRKGSSKRVEHQRELALEAPTIDHGDGSTESPAQQEAP